MEKEVKYIILLSSFFLQKRDLSLEDLKMEESKKSCFLCFLLLFLLVFKKAAPRRSSSTSCSSSPQQKQRRKKVFFSVFSVSIMLSIRINRPKDLRRTSSCSSLLKKTPQNNQETNDSSIFHKCFPLNLVYGKPKKNSVPIVVFQPVPEGVEHISHLIDSKCTFCHENCEKVHRDCMRLNIVSRGTVLTASSVLQNHPKDTEHAEHLKFKIIFDYCGHSLKTIWNYCGHSLKTICKLSRS